MKIKTDFEKEKAMIAFPAIVIGYNTKLHKFTILFMFICWAFSIEFIFK